MASDRPDFTWPNWPDLSTFPNLSWTTWPTWPNLADLTLPDRPVKTWFNLTWPDLTELILPNLIDLTRSSLSDLTDLIFLDWHYLNWADQTWATWLVRSNLTWGEFTWPDRPHLNLPNLSWPADLTWLTRHKRSGLIWNDLTWPKQRYRPEITQQTWPDLGWSDLSQPSRPDMTSIVLSDLLLPQLT